MLHVAIEGDFLVELPCNLYIKRSDSGGKAMGTCNVRNKHL